MNTKPLNRTLALTVILLGLLSYNFIGAQWTEPTDNPPLGNVAPPINVSTNPQIKSGALGTGPLSVTGNMTLTSSAPTIRLSDADHRTMWLHNNSNIMYVLANRDATASSYEGPHPMAMYVDNNVLNDYVSFSNQIRATEYCDRAGGNCFEASSVASSEGVYFESDGSNMVRNLKPGTMYLFFVTGPAADFSGASISTCIDPATLAQTRFDTITGRTTQESHMIPFKVPTGVTCIRAFTSGTRKYNAEYVIAIEAKGDLPVATYSWAVGGWGSCEPISSCSEIGVQTRAVYCKNNLTDGAVAASRCTGTKPTSSQGCSAYVGSSCD